MAYMRRVPQETSLYKAVSQYFDPFVKDLEATGKSLPSFIKKTFNQYLKCGHLIYGSVRLYCYNCRNSRLVPFSCKRRGFCPSCSGRRMAEASVLQTESMIPHVPIRQWVLTFPHPLTIFLAYRPHILGEVLELFISVLRYFYRSKCLAFSQVPLFSNAPGEIDFYSSLHPNDLGVVTCIQRFTDALSLYPHFHILSTDGLFTVHDDFESAQFIELPQLTEDDMMEVMLYFKSRLVRRFVKKGYLRPSNHSIESRI